MLFNAVLILKNRGGWLNNRETIMGRMFIHDLKEVPSWWLVKYREEYISKETDIGSLMCSQEEPIRLVAITPSKKGSHGNGCAVPFCQPLGRGSPQPPEDLQLVYIMKPGASRTYPIWDCFEMGMNLIGTCSNASCISKLTRSKDVILNAHYGRIAMTKVANKFECPACKIKPKEREQFLSGRKRQPPSDGGDGAVGTFTPTNFLLSYGRTLFRFKKIGVNEPIKTVLMESMGTQDDYKWFNEGTEGSEVKLEEYDFIEITTVGKKSSPFICVDCNRRILEKEKEVTLACGHALHQACQDEDESGVKTCPVCSSELFENLREVRGTSRHCGDAKTELRRSGNLDLKVASVWNRERGGEDGEAGIVDKWSSEAVASFKVLEEEKKEKVLERRMARKRTNCKT